MFRRKSKFTKESVDRLNIILAIIFLLAGLVVYKLIKLQVLECDYYTAVASGQHQIYNKITPARGKIFMKDDLPNGETKLYPLATNKDFASVYAVPKKIKDPEYAADKLYDLFDKENTEKEVDDLFDNDDFFKEEDNIDIDDKKKEFKKIKKELEINNRKKEVIEKYIKKLSKKNDPYEPLLEKVDKNILDKVIELDIDGIEYIMKKHRYYPEKNIGSHIVGFLGYSKEKKIGQYGLEGFFNEELSGKFGTVKAEKSANKKVVIINDREYKKQLDGSDLILTINRSIEYIVCKKLEESAIRHGADGGTVIVMEPNTGAILAMCSWPNYDPNNYNNVKNINKYNNPAIFNQYEPGSIFKVITMAAGIDRNVISPSSLYEDNGYLMISGWNKPIKNSDFNTHGKYGLVDMMTVLEKSLNTGSIYIMEKTGDKIFAEYVKKFGFGEKTGIELETEGGSNINSLLRKKIRPVEAATASFGQGITATPLQMILAYSVIANGGILMKPYLVDEIIYPDGKKNITTPKQIRRVISEKSALLLSGMMVNVVDGGHAKNAGVKGYFVAGKTGTAEVADKNKRGYGEKTIHTFVGFSPVEEPKFVMLVKLDDPKDVNYSASSAAPLFGDIAKFILNYYKVPKER